MGAPRRAAPPPNYPPATPINPRTPRRDPARRLRWTRPPKSRSRGRPPEWAGPSGAARRGLGVAEAGVRCRGRAAAGAASGVVSAARALSLALLPSPHPTLRGRQPPPPGPSTRRTLPCAPPHRSSRWDRPRARRATRPASAPAARRPPRQRPPWKCVSTLGRCLAGKECIARPLARPRRRTSTPKRSMPGRPGEETAWGASLSLHQSI